jgi:hypothetical protein
VLVVVVVGVVVSGVVLVVVVVGVVVLQVLQLILELQSKALSGSGSSVTTFATHDPS